jgi:S-methylmethionine-dependent homocysteine/selenocysteine methylase
VRSAAYLRLESLWDDGSVVVLDGGVGSELERLGFPRNRNVGDLWGTIALYEAPDLAREVHRRYAAAGADVVTTHTWRIDGVRAAERDGLVDPVAGGWQALSKRAVELARRGARDAGREECAIAFSVWTEPMDPGFAEELAVAIASAGPDLVLAETTETIAPDLAFPLLEPLLGTGLPVWVSFRWTVDGPPDLRSQGIAPYRGALQQADGELLGRAAGRLEELGVAAVLVNCLPRELVPGMLPLLRRHTTLPLGVYPNAGTYLDPGWAFDEDATPAAYAADALVWRDVEGARIVGGCCGTTPEHIAAVGEALGHR